VSPSVDASVRWCSTTTRRSLALECEDLWTHRHSPTPAQYAELWKTVPPRTAVPSRLQRFSILEVGGGPAKGCDDIGVQVAPPCDPR